MNSYFVMSHNRISVLPARPIKRFIKDDSIRLTSYSLISKIPDKSVDNFRLGDLHCTTQMRAL